MEICAMGTFNPDERRTRRSPTSRAGGPVRPVFESSDFRADKPDYKTAALCKQARRALSLALAGECGDPVLQTLIVDEVLPAPNAGRLLVRVLVRTHNGVPSVIDVLQRLAHVHGLLRASIGEAIVRKRTPELSFDVIALEAGGAP
jgi:ribosome-binding factor A